MTDALDAAALYENDAWLVTADGIEHKGTSYFIERDVMAQRRSDGLWTWPLQLAEKSWFEARDFARAFLHALLAYDIRPDAALASSLAQIGPAARSVCGEVATLGEAAAFVAAMAEPARETMPRNVRARRGVTIATPARAVARVGQARRAMAV
ncbi:hypothetical protein [Salinarimonas soli]|uniref:Uncharacterized protein n=1 Tax=Salinarimonas soli TaxID=1638099 RepID=A0A5B2VG80_9HYPH|nr:hypothetical protein [Salinarimonas soli]KAA2237638.1 hypothetical protein F0L46_08130 [Salinarimonas soli]